jgi:hypothetical protein
LGLLCRTGALGEGRHWREKACHQPRLYSAASRVLSLSRLRRLHDICRTVAARSAELGIQPHVIEAVLNHASGHKAGVAGVYNRALYAAEKRKALELWSEHVRALAEGIEQGVILLQPRYPAA